MKKTLLVSAIKNGSVIDHITAGQALNIVQILNIPTHHKIITVGINLPSKTMDYKDLIKIEDKEITEKEVNSFAFLAPQATINIISNYKIIKKYKVKMPKTIFHIIVCPNPVCISNNEKMESVFCVVRQNGAIELQCKYCEKIFSRDDIRKYNN